MHKKLENVDLEQADRTLLKAGQAATRLAICRRKLWELTNSKQLTCIRFGRIVRYDPADLDAFIDKQRTGRK